MSSFFTLPSSQKKRKRTEPTSKRTPPTKQSKDKDDDSISGSDISDNDAPARELDYDLSDDSDEDFEDEDPAAKRVRLAEQYLANTQKEVLEDGEFDAAEVDQANLRRRMGERLKEDTGESKGKLYRWIGDGVDWSRAEQRTLRFPGVVKSFTGVAIHGRYVYAASKDLQLMKWEMHGGEDVVGKGRRAATTAKVVAKSRGNRKDRKVQHHHKAILCVAVSPDGKFVATGGADNKLIVWDAATLKPLKVFFQHRDSVTALAFRRGTNQLFSASQDRTVKIWSLDEVAYVETLFGHQDEIVDVAALAQEKCVSVGARDRTARLWKVVEESQLVFRGGGAPGTRKALERLKHAYQEEDSGVEMQDSKSYNEGSMDRVVMIDDDTFVTGSDNGSLSLWSIHKKKAVFILPLAHGVDPALRPQEASADIEPDEDLDESTRGGKQPRWITALTAIPFSDVIVSGSWDGYVRAWKISQDKRRIEASGAIGTTDNAVSTLSEKERLSSESLQPNITLDTMPQGSIKGIVNDLSIVDKGDRGKDGVRIAAAVGKEHRLGRWKGVSDGKDRVVVFEVPRKGLESDPNTETESNTLVGDGVVEDEEMFGGFD